MRASLLAIRRWDRFKICLALIALVALVLRLGYIAIIEGHPVGGDGRYYHVIASLLADGKGFVEPKRFLLQGKSVPWAPHPPAWPLVLSVAAKFGLRSVFLQQFVACAVGTATVVVVGLAGRRLARGSVGLIAAGIAAVYPNFWLYERELMSETLTLLVTATVVLLAYRFRATPTRGRAIALGLACGVLAVTHAEQLLLVLILAVPLVLLTRDAPMRSRIDWAVCATAAAVLVVMPWAAYNTARFDRPVLLGAQFGVNVANANCRYTYSSRSQLGFVDTRCQALAVATGRITGVDEAERDSQFLDAGVRYARNHLSRVPLVVAAREVRTWDVPVLNQMHFDTSRGTSIRVIQLGFVSYWILLPTAVAGAVILRRRRVPLLPLVAFGVTVSIATVLTYGFTRFRASADVAIVLLAAVAIDALVRRPRAQTREAKPGEEAPAARLSGDV